MSEKDFQTAYVSDGKRVMSRTIASAEGYAGLDSPSQIRQAIKDEQAWSQMDFRKMIDDALAKVPVEYRSRAIVALEAYGEYAHANLELLYIRDLTPEELAAREKAAEAERLMREHRERDEYERLRAKYEPKP